METGESVVSNRKRTESNGGSSDSDLSEGWNFVDQLDVNNHDAPSSDGESVEVIEADSESPGHVTDADSEPDGTRHDDGSQLLSRTESSVVTADEREPAIPSNINPLPVHEEMFDSSFCWFLFFATSAVLVSNLALMAADNVFDWNMDTNVDGPSFLIDLPIKPKPPQQNSFSSIISWADNEEVIVTTVEDTLSAKEEEKEMFENAKNIRENEIKYVKNPDLGRRNQPLTIDSHVIGKYFKVLSDITSSAEAKSRFAQALLILDALHIGLNDLEEIVTENTELHQVLKKQKSKLHDVLTEVEFGVSRSMERLATNILNKVQKLEMRFENQWCKLEENGHKEELKGLFYDCHEKVKENDNHNGNDLNYYKETKDKDLFEEKNIRKKRITTDDCEFEIDKDSTGKMYSTPDTVSQESGDYFKILKNEKHGNEKNRRKYEHRKSNNSNNNKNKSPKQWNDEKENSYKTKDNSKRCKVKTELPIINKSSNLVQKIKSEEPIVDESAVEIIIKYLKENCEKNNAQKSAKYINIYQMLKESVDDNISIPEEMFHDLYEKHCKQNDDTIKSDENLKKEYIKDEKLATDKSEVAEISRYLKEICQNNQNVHEMPKIANDYQKLKEIVDARIKIPEKIFRNLYKKHCKQSDDNYKSDNKFKKAYTHKEYILKDEKSNTDQSSVVEEIITYLRENCKKNKNSKTFNDYQQLKDTLNAKISVPEELFNKLYEKHCKSKGNSFRTDNKFEKQNADKKSTTDQSSTIEEIITYLRENCEKSKRSKNFDDYQQLKESISAKIRIPNGLFHKLYEKHCNSNDDSFKSNKKIKDEYLKRNHNKQNHEKNLLDDNYLVIEDHNQDIKNIEIRIIDISEENDHEVEDTVVLPSNKPRRWIFSYEKPTSDNKTNLSGDWFIKAGESRSKARWAHRRSDWLFERASHRRNHPQPPNMFPGRYKNWFFRRAWARQQCRHNPNDDWCHHDDNTVTISNPNSKFR